MMATVRHVTSGSGLKKILSRWIFVEQKVHVKLIYWYIFLSVDVYVNIESYR
jgi:hypothetical protein